MICIKDIISFLEEKEFIFEFIGNEENVIEGFSSLYKYKENTITWCKRIEGLDEVERKFYSLLVATDYRKDVCDNCIITDKPKNIFFAIVEEFFSVENIRPDIGEGSYISPNVKIGKNVKIGYNCVLDGDIQIGDNTTIYNNVSIINRVYIGCNCTIQSGVIIGHDDYGYIEDDNHNKTMIKHYGRVVIEDNVFIGSCCVINRGTIDDTIIGNGSKIDALCHISHNVELGAKSSLISGASLYGSVKTGENVYIASSLIKNQLTLGDNVVIGMGSVVLNDIKDNEIVAGIPARPLKNRR